MTLNPEILSTDVDALSPIDETLMGAVRENLIRIDSSLYGAGSAFTPVIQFKVNGLLEAIPNGRLKRADTAFITSEQALAAAQLWLDVPGTSGTLEVDLRKVTTPKMPILAIEPIFQAAITTFAHPAALNTQSVTRTTAQVGTQSITELKPALNVLSIVGLGANLWQYNLSAAPDADWVVGDTVTFTSCTAAANNGSFQIVRVNDYGSSSVIISNASGVAQNSAAGSALLRAYKYNLVNPASSEFVAGESALFSGHTTAANNGTLLIYAVNSGGNNLVVKNPSGATQANAVGTVDVLRFSYALASAAPASDFVVGDSLSAASHTSSANNGIFKITAVNNAGNNVQVYNTAGVVQGSAAGNVGASIAIIGLNSNPTGQLSTGDVVRVPDLDLTTSPYNSISETTVNILENVYRSSGFTVREINRGGTNNVVVASGRLAPVAVVAGTLLTQKKKVVFALDPSGVLSTDSWVEIEGTPSGFYTTPEVSDLGHQVLEVNRGGGANYNVVIEVEGNAPSQSSPAGWVSVESRSVFTTTPKITISDATRTLGQGQAQVQTNPAVLDSTLIPAGTRLALYILSVPAGAENMALQVR